jgi:hypothetical protein
MDDEKRASERVSGRHRVNRRKQNFRLFVIRISLQGLCVSKSRFHNAESIADTRHGHLWRSGGQPDDQAAWMPKTGHLPEFAVPTTPSQMMWALPHF